jgi:hypothetical protein
MLYGSAMLNQVKVHGWKEVTCPPAYLVHVSHLEITSSRLVNTDVRSDEAEPSASLGHCSYRAFPSAKAGRSGSGSVRAIDSSASEEGAGVPVVTPAPPVAARAKRTNKNKVRGMRVWLACAAAALAWQSDQMHAFSVAPAMRRARCLMHVV